MKQIGIILPAIAVCACGSAGADDAMAEYKAQAVNSTPITNAIASSNTLYFCKDHPGDRFDILCEACDVSLHDDVNEAGDIVGMTAWATHDYHELKPWEDGEAPRIAVSGERGDARFVADEPTAEASQAVFEAANAWCQTRRPGEFLIRKNEIEALFAGEAQ